MCFKTITRSISQSLFKLAKNQLLLFGIFLCLTVFSSRAELVTIDKIAASVNDEIITWSDIDKAIQFYPYFKKKDQNEHTFYLNVLQDLINHKMVYLEYGGEITLKEEDYTEEETAIIKKMGDYDKLIAVLTQYDMQWQDFREFIKEKVIYEKVLKQKFQLQISIPFQEIENFYNEQYLPQQLNLQLKPKTLIEMAPLIEAKLRKDRTEESLAEWLKEIKALYKIENKLLPGTG
ncbi:MAG TPA: hypothetical protein VK186_23530 [Candidatus Deferrimicrobium sp.]|nr:hypothetical protein [Candidatus Deferrimicrobium sp.]